MDLFQLIDYKASFEKRFNDKLTEFICFFQEYMWNGWDDENDPKFLTKEDFEAIEALADKIKHMTLNIGCPNSVLPMLESICTRKIKRWQGNNSIETEDHIRWVSDENSRSHKIITKGFKKGKQLKTISQIARVKKSKGYYNDAGRVLVGHFRWNNRGYTLSRLATDLLQQYLYSSKIYNY